MHVAVNALFLEQPHTGSGQYTRHLLAALPDVDPALRLSLLHGRLAPRPGRRGENVAKLLWEQAAVPLLAAACGADLLHVPYWAPPAVTRVPVVATIHDVIPALLPEYRGSRLVAAYTRLVSFTARRARRLIVDSECSKRDLVQVVGVAPQRVDVIPLAANPLFRPLDAGVAAAGCRQRWNLERPFLLYVGGNDVRKNVPTLLHAWSMAAARLPGHALVIAGSMRNEPPFFPDVRGLAAQLALPRLHFPGPVSDADKLLLLAACTAFVWPSRYEGFGLPPLEAMQAGAPVISSDSSSMPEVVGDAGVLVLPDDVDALAEALVSVASHRHLQTHLRAKGLERAAQFTWRRTAALTLESYRRAL
ncbi:MAG TPA: glycosyltransferase family 1 protein [Chloroflexota bacterium]|jgi:glycosyltransferase involved in cell wall biosynthesis